jgi:hypothetical protein
MAGDSTHLDIQVDVRSLNQAGPWLAQLTAYLEQIVGPKVTGAQGLFGDKDSNGRVYGTTAGATALTAKVDGLLSGLHTTLGHAVRDLDKIIDATGRITARYESVEDVNATVVNDAFKHANASAGAAVVSRTEPPVRVDPTPRGHQAELR